MARSAEQEQHDAVDVSVLGPGRLLGAQVTRQREPERGQRAGVEEVAAGQGIAERGGFRGVEAKHGTLPGRQEIERAVIVGYRGGITGSTVGNRHMPPRTAAADGSALRPPAERGDTVSRVVHVAEVPLPTRVFRHPPVEHGLDRREP